MLTYRSSDAPTGLEDASITAPREMADPGAAVVLDVDSQRVRAVMIDSVEGESRFIASVEVMSTLGMPVDDLSVGVREALALLAGQTGVRIDNETDDVDAPDTITMTGFPAPPLNVAIVPAGTNPLTAVLTLTSWATPSFVHLLTDAVRTEDGLLSATLLEIRLRGLQPDIVVMLEGDRAQSEWASAAGAFGSLMSDGVIDQLIVLAADEFQQYLIQALGEDANMTGLDPSQYEAHEVAMALETELEDLYEQRVASSLRLNVGRPVKFVSRLRSGDLATRYIARRLERSVVSLDISSGTSICWSNAHSGGSIARPDLDVHNSVRTFFDSDLSMLRGAMPFDTTREDLSNWILNRAVRPRVVSDSRRDQVIESILVSSAVDRAWGDLQGVVNDQIDLVVAGPAFCFDADPTLGVLAVLNALQPAPLGGFMQILLDPDGLLWTAGAIGDGTPAVAAESIDNDLLTSTATVVVVEGSGAEGQPAVSGKLTYEDGEAIEFSVASGSMTRLPLGDGDQATLVLTCEAGFAVGGSNPGEQMQFGPEEGFIGGEVGVIIDARGRPFSTGAADLSNREAVEKWYSDLGIDL